MIRNPAAVIIILICLIVIGLFYAFSSALKLADEEKLSELEERRGRSYEFIRRQMDDPRYFVRAVYTVTITGIFFATAAAAEVFVPELAHFFAGGNDNIEVPYGLFFACAALIVFWVMAVLFAAFGFLFPKKRAVKHPERTLISHGGVIHVLMIILMPVTVPAAGLSSLLVKAFGLDPDSDGEEVTEKELISIVDEAHEQGVIKSNEAEMIQNIMELRDITARDVMTHRNQLAVLDGTLTLEEAMKVMLAGTNSRFPVFLENIDNIIGILHIKDAMNERMTHPEESGTPIPEIPGLLREAVIIPESRSIDSILQYMQAEKEHLLIAIDEYGQTSGVISMEDILEEIVGNILDEYDPDEHFVQHNLDNSIVMDGLIPLDEAEEALQTDFATEEFETLSGFLTGCLGHIPTERDRAVSAGGFLFQIMKVENHTIRKVRAVRLPKEGE